MIKIGSEIIKKQPNFWNAALFHPTDAVEDPWGKRIIDRLAADRSIHTIRIYSMFEDIVYLDENGKLQYDFRVSDLRLDYLTSLGFNLLIAYGGMPDCIASSSKNKTSVSKNKTRYKGKMWNTSPPRDYALWEEICYEYTKHNIERYGIETVSHWHCQCFNEPDIPQFFFSELSETSEDNAKRCEAYCKLYAAFERGVLRASKNMTIGGPALAWRQDFLGEFLDFVKKNGLRLDFISLHNYGTSPSRLNNGTRPLSVQNNINGHEEDMATITAHGFGDTEIIVDEWGGATSGFYNREECPDLMFRETEVFSAYYAKLIAEFIRKGYKISNLIICLSGQHEMLEDFSGFRNFFTLNFIKKPIYNAFVLASRLGEYLLTAKTDNSNIFTVPTKNENGDYAILLSYSSENFREDIPDINEALEFDENVTGRRVEIFRIDKTTTNPYRLYERERMDVPTEKQLEELRREGCLASVYDGILSERLTLKLTPNSTFLISIKS